MKMQSTVRSVFFGTLVGIVSLGVHAQTASEPQKPCVIVMGGGGTVTGNPTANDQWFVINSAVSRAAKDVLEASGLRAIDFVVDIRDADKRATELARQIEQASCQRVLQITHELRPPSKTKPPEKFAFVATVLEVDTKKNKKKGGKFTMVSKYSKDYEYAMTREVLEKVSMSEVGKQLARDVLDSGTLK
jgi:uncharacterized protein YggE